MKTLSKDLKEKDFHPSKYQWCRLEDGSIEPLYYGDQKGNLDLTEPRMFYKERRQWWLDHDEFIGGRIDLRHSKIIEFATTKEELR